MKELTFKQGMAGLLKYFGRTLDDDIYAMYWGALQSITDQQFGQAVKIIIAEFRPTNTVPFPLVADFLSACGLAGESRAQTAINRLHEAIWRHSGYESINFHDSALHAVIKRFGGWPEVYYWDQHEWDINEGRMVEAYRAAVRAGERGPEYMIGIIERTNGLGPWDKYTPEIIDFPVIPGDIKRIGRVRERDSERAGDLVRGLSEKFKA